MGVGYLLFYVMPPCQRHTTAVLSDLNQQEAIDCGENLPWSSQQTAALLLSVRNLTDSLHKHQLRGRRMSQRHACWCVFSCFMCVLLQKCCLRCQTGGINLQTESIKCQNVSKSPCCKFLKVRVMSSYGFFCPTTRSKTLYELSRMTTKAADLEPAHVGNYYDQLMDLFLQLLC